MSMHGRSMFLPDRLEHISTPTFLHGERAIAVSHSRKVVASSRCTPGLQLVKSL